MFNNAGYIVTGFYDSTDGMRQASNLECNAAAAAAITHHFLALLLKSRKRGCIVFTSSVVAYIPSPFAAMYGATKAFLSNLAASLAVEVCVFRMDV